MNFHRKRKSTHLRTLGASNRQGKEKPLRKRDGQGDAVLRLMTDSYTTRIFLACYELFKVSSKLNLCNSPSYKVDINIIVPIRDEDIEVQRLSDLPKVTEMIKSKFPIHAVHL